MNTKITLTTIEVETTDRNWQYLYLRLLNRDDLADAVRSGEITVAQSEQVLSGEMQWPIEDTEESTAI